jgi:hypothetical protein
MSPHGTPPPEVLQSTLPPEVLAHASAPALPGVAPLAPDGWLRRDEAFAGQMAWRDYLLSRHRARVLVDRDPPSDAARELLDMVLDRLSRDPGYRRAGGHVIRPDGVAVDPYADTPLAIAARLVQEDLLLHERGDPGDPGAEHVLTEGVLCFPALWTLTQKVGRPLTGVHGPVAAYDPVIARRVQRLFDGLQPGRPLWRANYLRYPTAALHTPRQEGEPRPPVPDPAPFYRSELQALVRLPGSRAVLFTIHTCLVPRDAVPPDRRALFGDHA